MSFYTNVTTYMQRPRTTRVQLRIQQQILLLKQLSYLLHADVPLLESITTLKAQGGNTSVASFLSRTENDVRHGHSLARSFATHARTQAIVPALIAAGELSGTLPQTLAFLADELRNAYTLRKKVVGALIYPALVALATVGIVGALTLLIFPKIIPVFTSMHIPLPFTTSLVLRISTTIDTHWRLLLLSGSMLTLGVYVLYTKTIRVRTWWDIASIHVPFFGKMIRGYTMTTIFRTLGTLLASGMTLSEALHITTEAISNTHYRAACALLYTQIQTGQELSRAMKGASTLFPAATISMVATGERTGNLAKTALYLGEMYALEVDDMTKNMSAAVEPVLMIVMGLLVGFIALSIITPIYEITQHLNAR